MSVVVIETPIQHLVGTFHVNGTVLGAWEGEYGIGLVLFFKQVFVARDKAKKKKRSRSRERDRDRERERERERDRDHKRRHRSRSRSRSRTRDRNKGKSRYRSRSRSQSPPRDRKDRDKYGERNLDRWRDKHVDRPPPEEPAIGDIYNGKVTSIMQFGCFVQLEGLR